VITYAATVVIRVGYIVVVVYVVVDFGCCVVAVVGVLGIAVVASVIVV